MPDMSPYLLKPLEGRTPQDDLPYAYSEMRIAPRDFRSAKGEVIESTTSVRIQGDLKLSLNGVDSPGKVDAGSSTTGTSGGGAPDSGGGSSSSPEASDSGTPSGGDPGSGGGAPSGW